MRPRRAGRKPSYWMYLGFRPVRREGVTFAEAAVATDSIATAYHAVRTMGEARPGQVVGIVGLGGLGLMGVAAASVCGSTVYGVDVNTATFDMAREQGARDCFTSIGDLVPHPT